MTNVIVAFSRPENGKNIKNILVRHGFSVSDVCTSGAQAIQCADKIEEGILVCGYRFADMVYEDVLQNLPAGMRMLLVASPEKWSGQVPDQVVCLAMPLKVQDLVDTMEMMMSSRRRAVRKRRQERPRRSEEEEAYIRQAKELLMGRNGMTEEEAHRYLQKCSMENGINLVETAQMVLRLMNI